MSRFGGERPLRPGICGRIGGKPDADRCNRTGTAVRVQRVRGKRRGSVATTAPSGFDEFYAATAPRVTRHVYALCGDLAEAQDVVADAYARAWQRWATVSTYDRPEAWVRQVAHRLAISRWRRTRIGRLAWQRYTAGTGHVPDMSPDVVMLVTAMRKLPAAQREVIVLHHLADMSVDDVAAELGIPVGTVKARLFRGRAALAALLDDRTRTSTATESLA